MNDTRCEIRNRKSRHTISGSKDKDNYIKVNHVTRDDDVVGSFKFHRLIMHHYFPQENENELQVDHINHDRSDNRLLNLQWVTGKDNMHNLSKTNVYEFEYTSDLPKDIIDVTKDLQSQQTMFFSPSTIHFYEQSTDHFNIRKWSSTGLITYTGVDGLRKKSQSIPLRNIFLTLLNYLLILNQQRKTQNVKINSIVNLLILIKVNIFGNHFDSLKRNMK